MDDVKSALVLSIALAVAAAATVPLLLPSLPVPVFEDGDGRQYVVDDGERVYGVRLVSADEPLPVPAPGRC